MNNPSLWTEEETEYLKTHYRRGFSKECADHLGKSVQAVRRKVFRLKLGSKRKPPVTEKMEQEILRLREEGRFHKEIAKMVGITDITVRKVLAENGISTKWRIKHIEPNEQLAKDFVDERFTLRDILKKHSISSSSLYRFAAHFNLKSPPSRLAATRGDINGRRGGKTTYELWVNKYGEEEADRKQEELKKKISANSSGENNPMYGKPSPQGSGNGWKGWYKDHYFRSLREVMFMIEMDAKGMEWKSAETKEYTIEYEFMGKARTYRPDFIVSREMRELKPHRLHDTPAVVAKRIAAEAFCAQRGLTYRLEDVEIRTDIIVTHLDNGNIKFARDYEKRFREWVSRA